MIIKLTNDIARTVNNDPTVRGLLKVVFIPNYNVSLAENIIPAADLSEQISTAGYEASGTSNMKFGLNGALTIGTMDGANVEMCERVGAENMFIFGLSAQQVEARKRNGEFNASAEIAASHRLNDVLQAIRGGVFSHDDPARYTGLIDSLIDYDRFLVCADFDAYWEAVRVEQLWHDKDAWWRTQCSTRRAWAGSPQTAPFVNTPQAFGRRYNRPVAAAAGGVRRRSRCKKRFVFVRLNAGAESTSASQSDAAPAETRPDNPSGLFIGAC